MATIPVPQSYQQILGQQLNAVRSRLGIRKFKPGGPFLNIFEASSQVDARNAADIFTALQSQDLDNAEGLTLDRIGNDEKLPRNLPKAAVGNITISDTAFQKSSSTLYHGKSAPIVGSTVIYVTKGATFDTAPSSGQIYLGRGTTNYEGPISYSSKVDNVYYWAVHLSSPTTLFHNQGESIILAQGGLRPINVGQIVSTPQGASTAPISYSTTVYSEIPDGETEVTLVSVVCSIEGAAGNVEAGGITNFASSPPFPTAVITNPSKISYGRDVETDQQYRDRIRQARANKQRGTDYAIKNAIIGVTSPDETSSILSSNVIRRKGRPTVVYIDDGTGYEEKSDGVGFEQIIESASGGETDFLSIFSPVSQATLEAQNLAPYIIPDGAILTVKVGGQVSTHYFDTADFSSSAASAYDVVSSINADSRLLFQARITENGGSVAIFAKSEENDDLEVIPSDNAEFDASVILGLSTTSTYTTSVYKNDVLLSKDGEYAQVISNSISSWSQLVTPETITINVDKTGDASYTVADTDFQSLGYPVLSNATTEIWAAVLNSKIPGVTATVENDKIILTSNRGKSNDASIGIVSGSLVTKGVFPIITSYGTSNDYSIDRSVGTVSLSQSLAQGDKLSFGTQWADAFVETNFGSTVVNVSSDSSYYLNVDDTEAVVIPTSIFKTGVYETGTQSVYNNSLVYWIKTSGGTVPVNTITGDWVLLTDSIFDDTIWSGIFRCATNDLIAIQQPADIATRIGHTVTATSDTNSDVIVMGGCTSVQKGIGFPGALKGRDVTGSCQKYNPNTGYWTPLPDMITPRAYHTATLIGDKIFICGGSDSAGNILSSTEIFDITTGTFTAGPIMTLSDESSLCPRIHHTSTLLDNENVVIVGGVSTGNTVLDVSVEYNPSSNSYQNYSTLNNARYGHQAVQSASNVVTVMGGVGSIPTSPSLATPISSVEKYVHSANTWSSITSMNTPRAFFGGCFDGTRIIVAGNTTTAGFDNFKTTDSSTGTFEVCTPGVSYSWTQGNLNSTIPAITLEFSQNDLVVSTVSKNIIAGCVNSDVESDGKALRYNVGTGNWDDVNTASSKFPTNTYTVRGVVGAALIGGTKGDTVAWFGGAVSKSEASQSFSGRSVPQQYDSTTLAIGNSSTPFPSFSNLTLNNGRITAVRSKYPPTVVTLPSNSSYTANSFVDSVPSGILKSDVYQTTKARLSTLSADGSLLLLDKDPALPNFSPTGKIVLSQKSQYAYSTSRNKLGVPYGFQTKTVGATQTGLSPLPQIINVPDYSGALDSGHIPSNTPANGYAVGLMSVNVGTSNAKGISSIIGDIKGTGVTVVDSDLTNPTLGSRVSLRSTVPFIVGDPLYFAAPNLFAVTDALNITVDGDTDTKRFVIPMARKMGTNGTYQSPLSLKDADNSNHTISTAFGTDYNFNDFAVVSRARGISDSGDSTKSVLWRYFRYGEEGNSVAVRYVYPNLPSQPVTVTANPIQTSPLHYPGDVTSEYSPKVKVDIGVGSGALRQNRNLSPNTKIGITRGSTIPTTVQWVYLIAGFPVTNGSRSILNGDTTLRIAVPYAPGAITNLGLYAGNVLYYTGTVPSSSTLLTGQFSIKRVDFVSNGVWDIKLDSLLLNDGTVWTGTNPGSISVDPGQAATFDSTVIAGDLVTINHPSGIIDRSAMYIDYVDPNKQYLRCKALSLSTTSQTTPLYNTLAQTTDLQIFARASNTASSIVSGVNAIVGTPVTGTLLGSGSGTINDATWLTSSSAVTAVNLSDGINYVSNTNKPANTTINTTFDLKLPISSSIENADFANETFYLVPQLNESIVAWLNTPAITGLWSVSDITTCQNGTKIQIKSLIPGSDGSIFVEGGAANLQTAVVIGNARESVFNKALASNLVVTTSQGEGQGLCGGSFVRLDNTTILPKVTDLVPFWGSFNSITAIDQAGKITFSSAPYNVFSVKDAENQASPIPMYIDKVGDYSAIRVDKGSVTPLASSLTKPGNWLFIEGTGPQISSVNSGTFKILWFSQTETSYVFWVTNPRTIEETPSARLSIVDSNSPIIGDSIVFNNSAFNNKGSWIITDVGNSYSDNSITVSLENGNTQVFSGSINTMTSDVTIVEGAPNTAIKKVVCVSPNPSNSAQVDVVLEDSSSINSWQETAGTVITALDKLSFPNVIKKGADAYRYNTGLIAEAKRVLYGDSADVNNYPGYVADGASIMIQGPTIKRVKLAVQIRVQSNVIDTDIAGSVRSAISGVVNESPIGIPIAISSIISAVNSINGISSVSIMSPSYNVVQDQILIRGQEKAIIIDPENDIQVLFAGN